MDALSLGKLERLLLNKAVAFWLSPEGKEAVKHVLEGKESFRAHVESVDELGLWLRLPPKRGSGSRSLDSLLLLKWEYLATAQVGAEAGESAISSERQERIQ
jgi:hypothetical protein